MPAASMKQLLESGVHFGHQTRRWNPKMKPLHLQRAGRHPHHRPAEDHQLLDKSLRLRPQHLGARRQASCSWAPRSSARTPSARRPSACGMPYVSHRWLGGLLTNFATIRDRINAPARTAQAQSGRRARPAAHEGAHEHGARAREAGDQPGRRGHMKRLPDAVFIVDPKREAIATNEANRLGIPLIGLVDTNCDPTRSTTVIPGNDDAIRSCSLIIGTLARAIEEGRRQREPQREFTPKREARRPGLRPPSRPSPLRPRSPRPTPTGRQRSTPSAARGRRSRRPPRPSRRPRSRARVRRRQQSTYCDVTCTTWAAGG